MNTLCKWLSVTHMVILGRITIKHVCHRCKTSTHFKSTKKKFDIASLKYESQEMKILFGPKRNVKSIKTSNKIKSTSTSKPGDLGIIGEQLKNISEYNLSSVDLIDNKKNTLGKLKGDDLHLQTVVPVQGRSHNAALSKNEDSNLSNFKSFKDFKNAQKLSNDTRSPRLLKSNDPMQFVLNFPLVPKHSDQGVEYERFLAEVESIGLTYFPSVSKILDRTRSEMNQFFLTRWKNKMIKELGEEGFRLLQEETFRKGINFHACIQEFLSGIHESEIQIQPNIEGHWKSLQHVFTSLGDITALECAVSHPLLHYKGVFDCVGVYRDTICLIDWKTSNKAKPSLSNTYDNPLQVAAYLGAINSSPDLQIGSLTDAVIVIAYPSGEPAHVHHLNSDKCHKYWTQWLDRLEKYWSSYKTKKNED